MLPGACGLAEIPGRFLKHDFRAENPDVSSELGSIGCRLLQSRKIRPIKPMFSDARALPDGIGSQTRHLLVPWIA